DQPGTPGPLPRQVRRHGRRQPGEVSCVTRSGHRGDRLVFDLAMSEGDLILFAGRGIRRTLVDGQWWFAVVDIVAALSESASLGDYWFRLTRSEKDATGL